MEEPNDAAIADQANPASITSKSTQMHVSAASTSTSTRSSWMPTFSDTPVLPSRDPRLRKAAVPTAAGDPLLRKGDSTKHQTSHSELANVESGALVQMTAGDNGAPKTFAECEAIIARQSKTIESQQKTIDELQFELDRVNFEQKFGLRHQCEAYDPSSPIGSIDLNDDDSAGGSRNAQRLIDAVTELLADSSCSQVDCARTLSDTLKLLKSDHESLLRVNDELRQRCTNYEQWDVYYKNQLVEYYNCAVNALSAASSEFGQHPCKACKELNLELQTLRARVIAEQKAASKAEQRGKDLTRELAEVKKAKLALTGELEAVKMRLQLARRPILKARLSDAVNEQEDGVSGDTIATATASSTTSCAVGEKVAMLSTRVESLERELQAACAEIAAKQKENTAREEAMRVSKAQLQKRVDDLKAMLNGKNAECEKLQKEKEKRARRDSGAVRVEGLERELQTVRSELAVKEREMEAMRMKSAESEKLRNQIRRLKQNNKQTVDDLLEKTRENAELTQKLKVGTSELSQALAMSAQNGLTVENLVQVSLMTVGFERMREAYAQAMSKSDDLELCVRCYGDTFSKLEAATEYIVKHLSPSDDASMKPSDMHAALRSVRIRERHV